MKFTKLLVMSALWLIGLNANAVDLIERTAPEAPSSALVNVDEIEKTPAEFVVGNYYVIFNKGAQQFFTEGNAWGTQASLGNGASLARFTLPSGKTLEDATLIFNDFSPVKNAWKQVFFDSATAMFVDRGSQANYFWQVVPVEGQEKTYRLQASPSNPTLNPTNNPGFVGVAADAAADAALSPFLAEGWIDWEFYSVPEWNAYGVLKDVYDASEALKAAIEKGEEAGVDVAAAVAVYNNMESTLAQIEEATAALEAALADNVKNATGQNPQDASGWIVNGTFDTIGDFTGWSTNNGKFGAGGTTSTNAEVYGKNAFDINQNITVKYPGLYLFGVKGFYRAGSSDESFKRWSENSEDARLAKYYVTVNDQNYEVAVDNIFDSAPTTKPAHGKAMSSNGYFIPNTMADANEFFHKDLLYSKILPIEISGTDVSATIGVKKETATSYDTWSIFDDFTLVFCGAGEDRWVGYAKMLAASFPIYAEDSKATASYLSAYNALKGNPTATNQAEAETFVANLKAVKDSLDLNIALWAQYSAAVVEAQGFVKEYVNQGQGGITQVAMLNAYVNQSFGPNQAFANGSAAYIMQALALENEALQTEIAFLASLKKAVIDNVVVKEGTDVTSRLTNPAFDTNDWTGWTHQAAPADPNQATNVRVGEYCCEAWNNASFNIYQEVTDMPVGIYEISVQGFYRQLRGDNAWSTYQDAPNLEVPTYIYMNDNTTPFKNVFSEPVVNGELYTATDVYTDPNKEYWYPDGMASSAQAFNANMYMNSAYGAVVNSTDVMRLGVKGSSNQGHDSWVIFDNFKLTYWGKKADKVKPALEQAIAEVEALQAGRMGKNVKEDVATAILNGQEAAQGEDGDVMFNALVALYSAKAKVADSKALMDQLASVNDSLGVAVSAAQMDAVLGAALTLYEQVANKLAEQDIADDEVAALIEQIHAQMAIADKCVELKDALTDLEEKAQVTQEEKEQGEVSEQWENQANELLGTLLGQIDDGSLDVTKIDEYLEQIKQMISTKYMPADMDSATDENPVVCTKMLAAPNFSVFNEETGNEVASLEGWTYTDGYEAQDYLMLGYYNKTFDVYQELAGIPNGTYEVKAQGFYRFGASQEDADMFFQTKADSSNVFLYATSAKVTSSVAVKLLASGGVKTQIGTTEEVIDEGTGESVEQFTPTGSQVRIAIVANPSTAEDSLYVPNNVQAAAAFFKEKVDDANRFENSVIVKVTDGTLRLGIKKDTGKGNDWSIFDNFRLIYYGANSTKNANDDPSGIERTENATAKVLRTEYFMFNGVRTANVQKGMAIVRQIMSDGTVVVKKVNLK